MSRKKIYIICAVVLILSLFVIVAASTSPETKETAKQATNEPTKVVVKDIKYEILQRWEIPNGGEGKSILISKDNLNEKDMAALGEKLKEDTKDDRNAFIFVYTDKKAAGLRDKVLTDDMTEAERDLYDINYVGQYNKNGNSGFHQFAIYFDGVMGTNSKTIEY